MRSRVRSDLDLLRDTSKTKLSKDKPKINLCLEHENSDENAFMELRAGSGDSVPLDVIPVVP